MNRPNNQRHQDTEKRIHEALMAFLQRSGTKLPTVLEICQAAQINRSTFYRHYQDVYDLMARTEQEIQRGLLHKISDVPAGRADSGVLEAMLRYIAQYRTFYQAYLRDHTLDYMGIGFQTFFEDTIKPMFQAAGVRNEAHMDYYYRFIRAGCLHVIGSWLESGCPEPPEEMAKLLENILKRA